MLRTSLIKTGLLTIHRIVSDENRVYRHLKAGQEI